MNADQGTTLYPAHGGTSLDSDSGSDSKLAPSLHRLLWTQNLRPGPSIFSHTAPYPVPSMPFKKTDVPDTLSLCPWNWICILQALWVLHKQREGTGERGCTCPRFHWRQGGLTGTNRWGLIYTTFPYSRKIGLL